MQHTVMVALLCRTGMAHALRGACQHLTQSEKKLLLPLLRPLLPLLLPLLLLPLLLLPLLLLPLTAAATTALLAIATVTISTVGQSVLSRSHEMKLARRSWDKQSVCVECQADCACVWERRALGWATLGGGAFWSVVFFLKQFFTNCVHCELVRQRVVSPDCNGNHIYGASTPGAAISRSLRYSSSTSLSIDEKEEIVGP